MAAIANSALNRVRLMGHMAQINLYSIENKRQGIRNSQSPPVHTLLNFHTLLD